jgi:hypothetical protein
MRNKSLNHRIGRRKLYPAAARTALEPVAAGGCEAKGNHYIFGLSGNAVLDKLMEATADGIRVRRGDGQHAVPRGYAETRHAAKNWARKRRTVARIQDRTS